MPWKTLNWINECKSHYQGAMKAPFLLPLAQLCISRWVFKVLKLWRVYLALLYFLTDLHLLKHSQTSLLLSFPKESSDVLFLIAPQSCSSQPCVTAEAPLTHNTPCPWGTWGQRGHLAVTPGTRGVYSSALAVSLTPELHFFLCISAPGWNLTAHWTTISYERSILAGKDF